MAAAMGQTKGPVDASYSNYMTGPGIQLPPGMTMGGDPPPESLQAYLLSKGAREIAGKDPYASAFEKTTADWSGWYDRYNGFDDSLPNSPANPKFRAIHGKKFDEDLARNQAEAMAERDKGMDKVKSWVEEWKAKQGDQSPVVPADVMGGLGIKALPGAPDPLDYQGGQGDASKIEQKAREEDRKLYRATMEERRLDKEAAARKKAELAKITTELDAFYTGKATQAKQKLAIFKNKLADAEKLVAKDKTGDVTDEWKNYISQYKTSIANLEGFIQNIPDYQARDLQAIQGGNKPTNALAVDSYWKTGVGSTGKRDSATNQSVGTLQNKGQSYVNYDPKTGLPIINNR